MRRRDFIKVIGGAATWPVAVRAQQSERKRRIGVLSGLAESDPSVQPMVAAFEGALAKLGWTGGSNVVIEYRWGGSDADTIRAVTVRIGCRANIAVRQLRANAPAATARGRAALSKSLPGALPPACCLQDTQ